MCRAVIKRRGLGISPGYSEHDPQLLSLENRRKIEPNKIPSCLIPRLLVVFTQQLEILLTTLIVYAGFTVSVYFNVVVKLLSYFAVGFGTRSCFPFWGEVICWLPGGLGAPKISNNTLIVILLSIQ